MVRTFLKVYMELGSYFLFLQEQIKDIIINNIISLSWAWEELKRSAEQVCMLVSYSALQRTARCPRSRPQRRAASKLKTHEPSR